MFEWIDFLDRNGIEYVTEGPNVAKNNINVHCPLCGAGDPSHHLGISLVGPWWGCWRDPSHRGRSAARLIQLLLECSWEQAQRLAGESSALPDDILSAVEALLAPPEESYTEPTHSLKMPDEFLPFSQYRSARYYRQYLARRGYSEKAIDGMTDDYGLRYCKEGPFGGRIIFPVFYEGKLVTWTGRSIFPSDTLRYKTLTVDSDRAKVLRLEPAAGNISDFLLWYDEVAKAEYETLVVVEGPFDALRMRTLGESHALISTCFFTSAPSKRQVDLLLSVLPKYRKRYLLLDEGTLSKSLALKNEFDGVLSSTDLEVLYLPEGVKDPGELSRRGFSKLFA